MTDNPDPAARSNGHVVRRLDTPEAREYAEWCLLELDLQRCLRVARLWKQVDTEGDKDIAASLFRDAVVSFIACFDKNLPVTLDATALYDKHEGGLDYFRWLSAIRDTWIAHRHGASRQTSAAIVVNENTGEYMGLGQVLMAYSRPVLAGADDFILFVSIALRNATARKCALAPAVETQTKSMHPSARLRLPVANAQAPTGGALRVGRKKFANTSRLTANQLEDLRSQSQPSEEPD